MSSTIAIPGIAISPVIREELSSFTDPEGQVIVHGKCYGGTSGMFIRIWPSTFLFDCHSSHRSELIYFEKITGFPFWTPVEAGKYHFFTLVFTALPSTCTFFDLKEIIPQSYGFEHLSIERNREDVYHLDFTS